MVVVVHVLPGHSHNLSLPLCTDQDGSEPTPNSVSASNLHRFSCYLNRKLAPSAANVYAIFKEMLTKAPVALCGLLGSFMWHTQTPKQVNRAESIYHCIYSLPLTFLTPCHLSCLGILCMVLEHLCVEWSVVGSNPT